MEGDPPRKLYGKDGLTSLAVLHVGGKHIKVNPKPILYITTHEETGGTLICTGPAAMNCLHVDEPIEVVQHLLFGWAE